MSFPNFSRTNPNLLTNPTFSGGMSGWTTSFSPLPVYDGAVSRTADGSGSVKFPSRGGRITSSFFPVTEGAVYSISAYGKDDGTQTAGFYIFLEVWAGGTEITGQAYINIWQRSAIGLWEENPQIYRIPTGFSITQARLVLVRFGEEPPGAGVLWVDDAYVGLGVSYGQAPPTRNSALAMANFRIDAEGNEERWDGAAWVPHLHIGIYCNPSRTLWSTYANKGFNVAMNVAIPSLMAKAKAAGMYFSFGISAFTKGYYAGVSPNWGITVLNTVLADVLANSVGYVSTWYLDFEFNDTLEPLPANGGTSELPIREMITRIHAWETTNFGGAMSPFSILCSSSAKLRYFNAGGPNLESAFHQGYTYETTTHLREMTTFSNMQNLTMQPGPPILPNPAGVGYRKSVYLAMMQGAKGYTFFEDGDGTNGSYNDVTTAPWWATVQDLNQELVDLIPLIRVPAITSWSVSINHPDVDVYVRTRELAGVGYVLLLNLTGASKSVTCTVTDLSYTATDVTDYFTTTSVATPSSNVFTFTLAALDYTTGTKVVKLVGTPAVGSDPVVNIGASPYAVTIDVPSPLTGVSVSDADNDITTVTINGGSNVNLKLVAFTGTLDI